MSTILNNLEYYKVFYHAARAGSLTVAARELNISQPAVSQSLKQLEGTLGVRLLARASRGVRLTAEGELLYGYVARGYEQILSGEQKLRQMLELELGEIHIGASDMTLRFYLLPYLERFHEKYPEIKVAVSNAPTPETLANLRDNKIDFGVVSTPFEKRDDLCVKTVREIEDVFVAGRRFIQYKNRMLDLQELEKMPLICLEGDTSTRSYMDAFLSENNVVIRPEFELATSDMIVQFAVRNLGIGSVVKEFAAGELAAGRLFELRFREAIPARSFHVVEKAGARHSRAAGALLSLLN